MGVLLVSIVVGVATRMIRDSEARLAIGNFFRGCHGIFLVMTGWIVKIIPVALFGFITATVVQFKQGINVMGLSEYFAVILLSNVVQGFVILPIFLYRNGIRPFDMLRKMLPALSVAFFSKSSVGTLPVTIKTMEQHLGTSPKITRLVLPLCTSINMNGCAAFIFITVIYSMQNSGIRAGIFTMILWVFISTLAAIGNAGIPMGCFFMSMSLLAAMNIPISLLGVILPLYCVIDMVETALNVWSDSCVVGVIDKKNKSSPSDD
jgi:Na+/H+-dicarboxylate symporter